MTTCDGCKTELSSMGVEFVAVVDPNTHVSYGVHTRLAGGSGLVPPVDRDLCTPCRAQWMIELLRPIANPDKVESKN